MARKEWSEHLKKAFGDYMEELRTAKGFGDRADLAIATGIDPATLANYASGKRSPSPRDMALLSRALKTDLLAGFCEREKTSPEALGLSSMINILKEFDSNARIEGQEPPVMPDWQTLLAAGDTTAAAIEYQRVTFVNAVTESNAGVKAALEGMSGAIQALTEEVKGLRQDLGETPAPVPPRGTRAGQFARQNVQKQRRRKAPPSAS